MPALRTLGVGKAASVPPLQTPIAPSHELLASGFASAADAHTSRPLRDHGLPLQGAVFKAAMIVAALFAAIASTPSLLTSATPQVAALFACIFCDDQPAWPSACGFDPRPLLKRQFFAAAPDAATRGLLWAHAAIAGRWQLPFAATLRSVSIHYQYRGFSLSMLLRYSQSLSADWSLHAMAFLRFLLFGRLRQRSEAADPSWPVHFLQAWDSFLTPLVDRWAAEDVGSLTYTGDQALRFWRNAASWYPSKAFVLDSHARLLRASAFVRPADAPLAPSQKDPDAP
jgi:hypothetical protein